jgi:hypothetical protein
MAVALRLPMVLRSKRASFKSPPDREQDQAATWSLTTLQRTLRRTEDGLPKISTYMILQTLHQAGYAWHKIAPGVTPAWSSANVKTA